MYKISEASKILGVHTNTLRKWDKNGILVALRFGVRNDRRYTPEQLREFMQGKKLLINEAD